MVPSASIPAVRQNRSKLTETASQALPTAPIPVGGEAIDVVLTFFMALLSFVDSTPRAYRLKASNAAPPISTFAGAIPDSALKRIQVDARASWFGAGEHHLGLALRTGGALNWNGWNDGRQASRLGHDASLE